MIVFRDADVLYNKFKSVLICESIVERKENFRRI